MPVSVSRAATLRMTSRWTYTRETRLFACTDLSTATGWGGGSTMVRYRVEWFTSGVFNRSDFEEYLPAFQWWHEVLALDEDATFERVEGVGF